MHTRITILPRRTRTTMLPLGFYPARLVDWLEPDDDTSYRCVTTGRYVQTCECCQ